MKFSLLETVVYHRWLWAELADRGCEKYECSFWEDNRINCGDTVENDCFPCELAKKENDRCSKCVFDFNPDCYQTLSLFQKWNNSISIKTRKKWAAKIRDVELKPRYKKILGEE